MMTHDCSRNRYRTVLVLGVLFALVFSACAPSLGKTLATSRIETNTAHPRIAGKLSGITLRVGGFEDSRQNVALGTVNDRELMPEGNPAVDVRSAFESAARNAGARVSQFDGVLVTGQVLDWKVEVSPAFPTTTIDARASIRLTISKDGTTPAYWGTFGGSVNSKLPYVNQVKVEEELGNAMAVAIEEALGNKRFQSELLSGTGVS